MIGIAFKGMHDLVEIGILRISSQQSGQLFQFFRICVPACLLRDQLNNPGIFHAFASTIFSFGDKDTPIPVLS
jgi:hypothetical protein